MSNLVVYIPEQEQVEIVIKAGRPGKSIKIVYEFDDGSKEYTTVYRPVQQVQQPAYQPLVQQPPVQQPLVQQPAVQHNFLDTILRQNRVRPRGHMFSGGSQLFRMHRGRVDLIKSKGFIIEAHNYYDAHVWYLVYTMMSEDGEFTKVITYDYDGSVLKDFKPDIKNIIDVCQKVDIETCESSLEFGYGYVKVGEYYCLV
jgi:hypothetical protein